MLQLNWLVLGLMALIGAALGGLQGAAIAILGFYAFWLLLVLPIVVLLDTVFGINVMVKADGSDRFS
jgi:hypothetical protein